MTDKQQMHISDFAEVNCLDISKDKLIIIKMPCDMKIDILKDMVKQLKESMPDTNFLFVPDKITIINVDLEETLNNILGYVKEELKNKQS